MPDREAPSAPAHCLAASGIAVRSSPFGRHSTCSFVEKAYHAQEAGALVAVVYDTDPENDA